MVLTFNTYKQQYKSDRQRRGDLENICLYETVVLERARDRNLGIVEIFSIQV